MVPPRRRGSDSRNKTHGRDALSGGSDMGRHDSGNGGGCMSSTTAVTGAVGAATAVAGHGLELLTRGGKDCRTLGQKLCPPGVFTVAGLEKEKKWRKGEERRFQK